MAFDGYNSSFPYVNATQRMMSLLPSWMAMNKDRNSVGQQFMNAAAGVELQNFIDYLDELLNNQFVGKANLGQISWIHKASYSQGLNADSQVQVKGYIRGYSGSSVEYNIVEVGSLSEFYGASEEDDVCIFDYENQLVYTRRKYESLDINGELISPMELHHVWNSFDEIGLMVGLARYHGESNRDFKNRIVNVFKYPGDSTESGLIRYISGQLGLVKTKYWPSSEPTLDMEGAIPYTIKIGSQFSENQLNGNVLEPKIPIFPGTMPLDVDHVDNDGEEITLPYGVNLGSFRTELIYPDNLDEWQRLVVSQSVAPGTKVIYKIRDAMNEVVREAEANGEGNVDLSGIDYPVLVEVVISRPNKTYDAPVIHSIHMEYKHRSIEVSYVEKEDVQLDTFFDPEFMTTMFRSDGSPTQEMRMYVKQLSDVAPILWDRFKWDEAYWDVVGKNLMGLDVLPNRWDPNITSLANKYLQVGIGDKNDLKTVIGDDWKFRVMSGYYFMGDKLDEYYLYASPKVYDHDGPTNRIVINDVPQQGAPIHVAANGKELSQVFSLSEDGMRFTTGDEQDSFCVNIEDNKMVIDLSDEYTNIRVTYESTSDPYYTSKVNIDPIINHIDSGFLYITNKVDQVSSIRTYASPDTIRANGADRVLITVDLLDVYGNPVLDQDVTIEVQGLDKNNSSVPLGNYGSLELSDEYYNRKVYRYTAMSENDKPQNLDSIRFTIKHGTISQSVDIKVR